MQGALNGSCHALPRWAPAPALPSAGTASFRLCAPSQSYFFISPLFDLILQKSDDVTGKAR